MESKYTLRVGKSDQKRLTIMNNACNAASMRFLTTAAGVLKPGSRVLEAGCGLGQMAALIAKSVLPGGKVDALDSSQQQLYLAREHLRCSKVSNVDLVNLSVLDIGAKLAGKYDLIYSRFLLEHLPDPVKVLKLFKKFLKPGGAVAAEVCDMSTLFCSPRSDLFDIWLGCQRPPVLRFNVRCGYSLHLLCREAGFKKLQIGVSQSILQTPQEKAYLSCVFSEYRGQLTGKGKTFAGPEDADRFAKRLKQLEKDARYIVGFPRITQICARV